MRGNLHRFFERYDVSDGSPDLQFLRQVTRAYSNLPYENVTKILKSASVAISDDKFRRTEEVLSDHLSWNTGGTCFSLCHALREILISCGFQTHIAMADMHYGANIHCAIIVTVTGQMYLVDPGYLLHDPIPLPRVQIRHETPMNAIVLTNEGKENYSLFTDERGIQRWRYRLRANPISDVEFEKHWLRSFSLNSMEAVMITRAQQSGRLYYRKDRLELVQPQRRTRQKITNGEPELLSGMFGLPADLILRAQRIVRS